ncbi:hypothetical protein BDR07DRAFT_411209 [Suillus spraguei]|nr:hypothetical protein BDR07DRAFT_411209 [Suillus spraguei]
MKWCTVSSWFSHAGQRAVGDFAILRCFGTCGQAIRQRDSGHTQIVTSLALLFNGALLISAYDNATIKLWFFESLQLLASHGLGAVVHTLIPSPDLLQLAYTTYGTVIPISIYSTLPLLCFPYSPPCTNQNPCQFAYVSHYHLHDHADSRESLQSDATRRPVVRRIPAKRLVIVSSPRHKIYSPTTDHQQPVFLRHVRKLFHFSSRTNSVPPVQPRDPWDFPATSPLLSNRSASP